MRLQRFVDVHNWTIIGQTDIQKDHFSQFYADGIPVVLVGQEGEFTILHLEDGQTYYVMTSDWQETRRLRAID